MRLPLAFHFIDIIFDVRSTAIPDERRTSFTNVTNNLYTQHLRRESIGVQSVLTPPDIEKVVRWEMVYMVWRVRERKENQSEE
jgi:hypothetical protein